MSIFDAIWRRRGRPSRDDDEERPELQPKRHIIMTDRDYSPLLERGNVAIKFWLPELMGNILDQERRYTNTSRSDLIRQYLFMYLYGRHDLWGLFERKDYHYKLNEPVLFSKTKAAPGDLVAEPEPDIMQDLGKNIEDLKVWIPRKMKGDIQALADKAAISLSEMIREIILSMLFGHTYLSARKELMQMKIEVEKDDGFDSKGEGVD